MDKPAYHILVCNSYRTNGEPKGVCNRKDAATLPQYIEEEVIDRGIDAMVSTTSCFKMCEKGPIMVIHPQGWWYQHVDTDKVDTILDALEEQRPVPELMA